MLQSDCTSGMLVANPGEKMISSDAYAVTSTIHGQGPCARSVFKLEHANECKDAQIRYGQDVRICTHAQLHDKELYLNSLPLTPMTFARYSRNQEVSVYHRKAYNTVWRIQPSTGVRQDRQGEPVCATDSVILEHVATANYLANDKIAYQNTFGAEMEVSCMAQSTKAKTQILLNESQGTQVRENTHKCVPVQNLWHFCLASEASQAEVAAGQTKVSATDLLQLIREHLHQSCTLNFACMIHGLTKCNDMIGLDEFVAALTALELSLNEAEYQKLFAHFQKNWN